MPLQAAKAQVFETWLGVEGGYLHQKIVPMRFTPPVYQTAGGFNSGLSLYYADQGSYHLATFSYSLQNDPTLKPSNIRSFTDRYLSLNIDYEYSYFFLTDILDLHLDFGGGPYLFVQNQISALMASREIPVEYNDLFYGGALNLVLRYNHSEQPLSGRINVVNGGFWGRQEINQQNSSYADITANGWLSSVQGRIGYRFNPNWRGHLQYQWTERVEYSSSQINRRTLQGVGFGVSYRLEDD
ncbi:hypothetical protein NC796_22610 [Aliifodinibius sp. S!AR15-10]|uniref:hypothetical protein n=1 Tax=Aliifodinibius sp. S!AR15-10 TaxID=2950437 RepID=UPI0028575D5D|nr:hypothetical protein [Aliifodinibius sp. S!AR15-10]MDR8393964.1 hypothetical protein [Aliifodinibius sp. S!AR15-10]